MLDSCKIYFLIITACSKTHVWMIPFTQHKTTLSYFKKNADSLVEKTQIHRVYVSVRVLVVFISINERLKQRQGERYKQQEAPRCGFSASSLTFCGKSCASSLPLPSSGWGKPCISRLKVVAPHKAVQHINKSILRSFENPTLNSVVK